MESVSLYFSNDIHFSKCSSILHAIIQTHITTLLYMNKDADFVFQVVSLLVRKSYTNILESDFQGMLKFLYSVNVCRHM